MNYLHTLGLSVFLLLLGSTSVLAEGFAMTEWSARGLSLANGLVARANDPSAIAYNAAGITQLSGTHVMGGFAAIHPYGTVEIDSTSGKYSQNPKRLAWTAYHGYLTHQYNDSIWLGIGLFTRFGLGNSYDGDWIGRYNVYDVGLQTVSLVPTIAYKVNDHLSLSLGVELMYGHLYQGVKIPTSNSFGGMMSGGSAAAGDNDLQVEAQAQGFGIHAGLHVTFNEQWSLGLAYKSQVTMNFYGDAEYARQEAYNGIAKRATLNSDVEGTVQLPDSLAMGLAWRPLPNLSFETDVIWTRWSTYNALNMYFDAPANTHSISNKEARDGWTFAFSVEYAPVDWLTLRAGYWHETPVLNENYADFMLPSQGRDVLTLGTGFAWNNWTLDLAYAHIWVQPMHYANSEATGIHGPSARLTGLRGARSRNVESDLFLLTLGYSF